MGAPFLVERGIDPSEEGLGPALIMRLLLELPEEGGYFRAVADLPPEAFETPATRAQIAALLSAYEALLDSRRAPRYRQQAF